MPDSKMTKREIFDLIISETAYVCDVSAADIINAVRKEDVVTARAILVFWCDAAGFSVESLLKCCDCNNANSINAIKAKQEDFWVNRFAYHMLVKEVGERLHTYALSIGEDFDMWKPLDHMAKITGKYKYVHNF